MALCSVERGEKRKGLRQDCVAASYMYSTNETCDDELFQTEANYTAILYAWEKPVGFSGGRPAAICDGI